MTPRPSLQEVEAVFEHADLVLWWNGSTYETLAVRDPDPRVAATNVAFLNSPDAPVDCSD